MKTTMKTMIAASALLTAGLGFAAPGAAEDVEKVYDFYCAQCHGLNGDGKGPNVTENFPVTPRSFTNATEMTKLTDADIINVIREGGPISGKSPMMPPWGNTISEADMKALLVKIREMCKCQGPAG